MTATWRDCAKGSKAQQLEIMPVSTEADQDDSGKATRQMERLVDEQRRRSPGDDAITGVERRGPRKPDVSRRRNPSSADKQGECLSVPALSAVA